MAAHRRRTTAGFVLAHGDDPTILGYYTLSQSTIQLADLPESRRKKLPRYPQVPASLLGRMAVDKSCRGKGYGELLLMDALHRAWKVSGDVGSYAVIVDAMKVEPDPLPFYLQYDFEPLPDQPRRLILPFSRYQELFAN